MSMLGFIRLLVSIFEQKKCQTGGLLQKQLLLNCWEKQIYTKAKKKLHHYFVA